MLLTLMEVWGILDEKAVALLQLAVRVTDCRVAPAGTDVSYIKTN